MYTRMILTCQESAVPPGPILPIQIATKPRRLPKDRLLPRIFTKKLLLKRLSGAAPACLFKFTVTGKVIIIRAIEGGTPVEGDIKP